MQFKLRVLQVLAVSHRDSTDDTVTHIQIGMQSDNKDNTFNITVPVEEADKFLVGQSITLTMGAVH